MISFSIFWVGKGLIRVIKGQGKHVALAELIPVDLVANLMIAAAWNSIKNQR